MSENNIEIIKKRGRPTKLPEDKINIKEYMKEYNKKYYEEHKPPPKAREARTNNLPKTIKCDICTCTVTTYTLKSHQKSKKCTVYGCLNNLGLMNNGQIID
jgi:hypothetical protein